MKLLQRQWTVKDGWRTLRDDLAGRYAKVQLVLIFGASDLLKSVDLYKNVYDEFPNAIVTGCSTAGEICGDEVGDNSLVCTAIEFEHSRVKAKHIFMDKYPGLSIEQVTREMVDELLAPDLVHLLVLAGGDDINASDVVAGLRKQAPKKVGVSGALAADAFKFHDACVIADVMACENTISVIAFYGKGLKVMTSLKAGWFEFGGEKTITKSDKNIMYQLDKGPALPFFELYLGDSINKVPASSFQYPISLRSKHTDDWLTRSIVKVDRSKSALHFAGDVPVGYRMRLMKTDTEHLVESAARATVNMLRRSFYPDFALIVSCFGRKGLMGKDSYKEVKAVRAGFGDHTLMTGFYACGEIGALDSSNPCQLHNQTLAITAFLEI